MYHVHAGASKANKDIKFMNLELQEVVSSHVVGVEYPWVLCKAANAPNY